MDKVVLFPSLLLGLILVVVYLIRCWRSGSDFDQGVMVNIIFQASGVVCGLFLIVGVFFDELRRLMTGIDLYILIGGCAVLTVSVRGFYKDAIKSTSMVEVVSNEAENSVSADS